MPATRSLLLYAALGALLPLAPASDRTDRTEEAEVGAYLSRELNIDVALPPARGSELAEDDRNALRRALGEASALIERVAVYTVEVPGRPTEDGPARVAVLELGEPFGGRLAVVVAAGGNVVARKVWGSAEFDGTPEAWDLYLGQFDRAPSLNRIQDPRAAESAQTLAGLRAELERESDAGDGAPSAATRALYRQRLIMRENSYRFSIKRDGMSGPGAADWLRGWKAEFERLDELASDVEPLLADEVRAAYRAAVQTGASILASALESVEAGDARTAALRTQALYSSSCQACHELRGHGLGAKNLYWSLLESLPELSVRDDFARVGIDVLALPGRAASSQAVATGLRACVLVLALE